MVPRHCPMQMPHPLIMFGGASEGALEMGAAECRAFAIYAEPQAPTRVSTGWQAVIGWRCRIRRPVAAPFEPTVRHPVALNLSPFPYAVISQFCIDPRSYCPRRWVRLQVVYSRRRNRSVDNR